MSIRMCCGNRVGVGRYCPTCGTHYNRMPLVRSASYGGAYDYDSGPSIGIDVTDGDPVLNLGNGIGIDLATGETELDFGGIDIPLD